MTERSLQEFFDTLRSAQQANRAKFADWYDVIESIDRCFVRAGSNLITQAGHDWKPSTEMPVCL
jgi:hypothetical protein